MSPSHRCTVSSQLTLPPGIPSRRWSVRCACGSVRFITETWPEAMSYAVHHFLASHRPSPEMFGWGDALVFHAAFARPRPRAA